MLPVSLLRIALVIALLGQSKVLLAAEAAPIGIADAWPAERSQGLQWRGSASDGDYTPSHPPIDEIPPMPLPDPRFFVGPAAKKGDGPGVPIVVGDDDRRVVEFGPYEPSGESSGGADGYQPPSATRDLAEDQLMRGFGTMTEITSPGAEPWRMNVKTVMRFVDTGGTDRFFVCSGSMADAETVLLAGHCIYAFSPGGNQINDWAREIWVYPGWDGNGSLPPAGSDVIQNFGVGYGQQFGAFTGWTDDGNFDWDMGVARVRRAVGMLTGWFGYRWGDSCDTIQARTYHLLSYPSEACGTTGLHNGRDMYWWRGSYDGCSANVQQLQLDTTPGCFTAQWGGMSGGGSYLITDTSARQVHSVVSNSDNSTFANHTRMWEGFKDFMLDFEATSRGNAFDLQLLRARYLGDSVPAGASIEGDDYKLVNATNADEPTRTYSITHYLSTNSTISTADTLLRSESVSWDFEPMQTLNVNTTGVHYAIPIDTPSGAYFIGAELTTSDANASNNDGSGWDAQRIQVQAVADIVAQFVQPESSVAYLDESLGVNFRYRNQGADFSSGVEVEIRLSTNTIISSADRLLANFTHSGLAGTTTRNRFENVLLPDDMTPGTYYVGLIARSADDVDTSNDTRASTAITVAGRSDLRAVSVEPAASSYQQGDTVNYSVRIRNEGLGDSGRFGYRVILSRDAIMSGLDPVILDAGHAGLGAGDSLNFNLQFALDPATLAPGQYHLGLVVEAGSDEKVLANNEVSSGVFSVTENCTAGQACLMFRDGFEN